MKTFLTILAYIASLILIGGFVAWCVSLVRTAYPTFLNWVI